MKRGFQYILFLSFVFLFALSILTCSKNIGGKYKLLEGDCQEFLIIKDLGGGKYTIILLRQDVVEFEIVGDIEGNRISAHIGSSPIHFDFQDNQAFLLYQDRQCRFEKIE
ncbi:MAG: hypothetical protein SVZ03_00670 [Spirochaetota bacterium]|nr:hypothetical protein [Spirochaetota bacterium]